MPTTSAFKTRSNRRHASRRPQIYTRTARRLMRLLSDRQASALLTCLVALAPRRASLAEVMTTSQIRAHRRNVRSQSA